MCEIMKTAVFTDVKAIQLEECERPVATGNKAVIKVNACALCTWEQRVYTGVKKVDFPFIGGHEVSGEIIEMGAELNKEEWQVGDKVVVGATLPCGNCYYCKSGKEESCEHFNHSAHLEGLPHKGMGGLSEYLLVKPEWMFKYENVTPEEATVIEPLSCVIRSVATADVKSGDIVLVIGCGIMGLLHVLVCGKKGATVIVSDVNDERLDLAGKLGASYSINPNRDDLQQMVYKITKGINAQAIFDTTPIASVVEDALKCVSNAGKVILYSSIHPPLPVTFDPNWVHAKSVQILGTANSNARDFMKATRMVSEHVISLKPFISKVFEKEDITAAFESAIKGDKFRVVVKF